MKIQSVIAMVLVSTALFTSRAFAQSDFPECQDENGSVLPVDNVATIALKTQTANGALSRAHAEGPITKLYPNQTGHNHFEISLGNASGDTLEVVYDTEFGPLPTQEVGMNVEVCGDFINSYAPENGYAASPDGAIIHWIHRTDTSKHLGGFIAINGVLYGQGGK
jgi:hypothetical protein